MVKEEEEDRSAAGRDVPGQALDGPHRRRDDADFCRVFIYFFEMKSSFIYLLGHMPVRCYGKI